ncbi:DUF721 domain-containing protein [Pleurocapsales cyanobacterium LEGE 10410]|nr:DUF721 domain-containing protein [Pleurocapsales cyanobacterium LEGE 10410]
MLFNSVEQILIRLEQQPGWEKFREYRHLLRCWDDVVSQNIAMYTRPLYINRQVLWVATSSAARAQELSFQRYTLLKKLNKKLPFVLKDLRFSSSGWQQKTQQQPTEQALFSVSDRHISKARLTDLPFTDQKAETEQKAQPPSSPATAQAAAKRWLETIKQNSSTFMSCPNCGSPTPRAEIERWNLCYHCIAQKWSQKYRPPSFPERS